MPINLHLWLVPGLCLAGFLLNLVFGRLWGKSIAGAVGVGFSGLALLAALWVAHRWSGAPYIEPHATWFLAGPLRVSFGLFLDPLSLLMMLIVTGVGFLIHLYSLGYMSEEGGFYRYFSLLNLFLFFMLTLVLAGNYLLLFAGWEGVGFASYILIGFFFRRDAAARAGIKAFVVNRIGDFGFLLGLFLIFARFGSFNYQTVFARAATLPVESGWHGPLTVIALLLLVGALGKSAQLPLYIWLPDAMEGPTPVSALIHAATMVTAGVYMIARSAVIYDHSPAARSLVLAIGALTAIFAASIGVLQRDIKRILAYSTISQIGYMFLALGVGAWSAAIFHFMVHAFFKALLFLSAGAITMRLDHEHDIFRMGGLAKKLPAAFWSCLIGAASLAALPLITAGFYSKEMILSAAWAAGGRIPVLWLAGIFTAFITSLYIFRLVFIVFFGAQKTPVTGHYGPRITLPLTILSILALTGGFVETPKALGGIALFAKFLASVFGPSPASSGGPPATLLIAAALVSLCGAGLAYALYMRPAPRFAAWAATPPIRFLRRFLRTGWGFDSLYNKLIVQPFTSITCLNQNDAVDRLYQTIALACRRLHQFLHQSQTGRIRWYAAWLAAGSLLTIAIAVLQ